MAGMGSTGAGLSILGGTMGGIGDIISSASYQRPKLHPATGMELRLRQLAQDQLLGGGQEMLGATALYNQLAPILMSQLPGIHYIPPTGGSAGMGSGQSTGGTSGGGGVPVGGTGGGYQSALSGYSGAMDLQNQLNALNAKIKGTKPGGGARKPLIQQRKALKQQIKGTQPVNQLERQAYMAGTQPGSFDISQGAPASMASLPSSLMPSGQTSLGDINNLLGQNQGPDLSSIYQSAANPGMSNFGNPGMLNFSSGNAMSGGNPFLMNQFSGNAMG